MANRSHSQNGSSRDRRSLPMQNMLRGSILVAILAAGRAARFGGEKMDRPCAGRPLGAWAIEALMGSGVQSGLIIAREPKPSFASGAIERGWRVIVNDVPERGIGHSIALAAREAKGQGAGALLIALGDMPLVGPDHFARLMAVPSEGSPRVATRYPGGKLGVPACFGVDDFAALSMLDGDQGAARLLDRPETCVLDMDEGRLIDVDSAEALARAEALLLARRREAQR